MKTLNDIVSSNLINLRKSKNLTQQQLAELFDYSDKTVSKWELGQSIPSVEVLKSLADFYGVSIDAIVSQSGGFNVKQMKTSRQNLNNKMVITALSFTFVWILAACIYVAFMLNNVEESAWLAFIWAIPGSLAICTLQTKMWWNKSVTLIIFISLFIWMLLLATFLSFLDYNLWYIFFIGIPVQVSVILFSRFK